MLGLTVPDAIAFGSLCAALLAAVAGMLRGERSKATGDRASERGPLAAGDDNLRGLTAAVADLAAAVRAATQAEVDRDQYSVLIHSIMQRLDARQNDGPR